MRKLRLREAKLSQAPIGFEPKSAGSFHNWAATGQEEPALGRALQPSVAGPLQGTTTPRTWSQTCTHLHALTQTPSPPLTLSLGHAWYTLPFQQLTHVQMCPLSHTGISPQACRPPSPPPLPSFKHLSRAHTTPSPLLSSCISLYSSSSSLFLSSLHYFLSFSPPPISLPLYLFISPFSFPHTHTHTHTQTHTHTHTHTQEAKY